MLFRTWAIAMLLGAPLFGGLTVSAQYSAPATPAPYNPIALAEVTGAPRTAVQAGQNSYQALSQNPYLGGSASSSLRATDEMPLNLCGRIATTKRSKLKLGGVP
jgi:hypothetical protein